MAKFHLAHCIPHPKVHGLNGYLEVIQTVAWGLEQLGHHVSYAVNQFAADATNIVFGAQVLPLDVLQQLPNDTIVYNFEQLRGLEPKDIRPEARYCASRFVLWDYSPANLTAWESLERPDVRFVPVGYAPTLSRIPTAPVQDIDVLFYGLTGQTRLAVFHALAQTGLVAAFVCGLYGPARDELVARSKLVLNVTLYEDARIFEVVRASYLLANRKAVVAEFHPDTYVEPDLRKVIRFAPLEHLAEHCIALAESAAARAAVEEEGFAVFARRDIRAILDRALAGNAC